MLSGLPGRSQLLIGFARRTPFISPAHSHSAPQISRSPRGISAFTGAAAVGLGVAPATLG